MRPVERHPVKVGQPHKALGSDDAVEGRRIPLDPTLWNGPLAPVCPFHVGIGRDRHLQDELPQSLGVKGAAPRVDKAGDPPLLLGSCLVRVSRAVRVRGVITTDHVALLPIVAMRLCLVRVPPVRMRRIGALGVLALLIVRVSLGLVGVRLGVRVRVPVRLVPTVGVCARLVPLDRVESHPEVVLVIVVCHPSLPLAPKHNLERRPPKLAWHQLGLWVEQAHDAPELLVVLGANKVLLVEHQVVGNLHLLSQQVDHLAVRKLRPRLLLPLRQVGALRHVVGALVKRHEVSRVNHRYHVLQVAKLKHRMPLILCLKEGLAHVLGFGDAAHLDDDAVVGLVSLGSSRKKLHHPVQKLPRGGAARAPVLQLHDL
mmetsp:Transcript_4656/g.10657  ORF Transcript_4656/g.10657 Transcript_4656/m.10657 type:complete len:371 (+) Transcript_4656:548-1660(+)